LGGKKHIGELTPFDLVVLLIVSETVQGFLIGDDTSLVSGLLASGTLFVLVFVVNYASWRSKNAERLFGSWLRFVRVAVVIADPGTAFRWCLKFAEPTSPVP
jgi:hypothetical protein